MTKSLTIHIFEMFVMATCLSLAALAQSTQAMQEAEKLYQDKNWAAAASALEAITKEDPSNNLAWLQFGSSRQNLQQYAEAITAYTHLEKDPSLAPRALYREAISFTRLNRKDEALAALGKAVDAGFVRLQLLQQDPELAPLRDDPAFSKIVATQGHDPAGSSSIQLILDKCVIFENWTGGVTGKSFNHYDPASRKWIQDWVDSASSGVHFEGSLENGVMSYYADSLNPDGTRARRHLQFFKLDDDHVRQFSQQSADGGKTWTVEYDLTYNRKTQ